MLDSRKDLHSDYCVQSQYGAEILLIVLQKTKID